MRKRPTRRPERSNWTRPGEQLRHSGVLGIFALACAACGGASEVGPASTGAGGGANMGAGGSGGKVTATGGTSTGSCSPGETRTCVGSAACSGGQLCGVDGTWGACDCGSGGAGGISNGGAGGIPNTGGMVASGAGGVIASGGASGAGSIAGAAGVGGAPPGGWKDDPCPPEAFTIDCSDPACVFNPTPEPCAAYSCTAQQQYTGSSGLGLFPSAGGIDLIVRTPSVFSDACACATVQHAYRFLLQVSRWANVPISIRVSPPWMVRTSNREDVEFCTPSTGENCVSVRDASAVSIFLFTSEPDPPVRNFTIFEGSCP